MTAMNDWIASHYALSTLISIPFYALGSYLAFKKSGYNFMEHGVMNLYLGSMKIVVNFALFPLLYVYNNTQAMGIVVSISFLLDILITACVYYSFFKGFRPANRVIRIILSTIYIFLLTSVIGIGIAF